MKKSLNHEQKVGMVLMYKQGVKLRTIATRYKCSLSYIIKIVNGVGAELREPHTSIRAMAAKRGLGT